MKMLGKIAWKNISYRPLQTAVCISMLLLGVGVISLLLVVQQQLGNKLAPGIQSTGSANETQLQFTLWCMCQLDAKPTRLIIGGIMLVAGSGMFFALLYRLRARKHELALMRSVGYSSGQLLGALLLEGVILAVLGYLLGWIFSRVGAGLLQQVASVDLGFQFGLQWVPGEGWLLLITFLIGIVAVLLPARQALRIDVPTLLSEC